METKDLTVPEAAAYLRCSTRHVMRLRATYKIQFRFEGRKILIPQESLDQYRKRNLVSSREDEARIKMVRPKLEAVR